MSKFKTAEDRALEREMARAMGGRLERIFRKLTVVLTVLSVLLGGAYMFFLLVLQPPEIGHVIARNPSASIVTRAQADLSQADLAAEGGWVAQNAMINPIESVQAGWREGVYTILIAGEDDEGGGTDVIMVLLFDTIASRIEVLSIPRDTIIDVPWNPGRINSIQHMFRRLDGDHDSYVYALIDEVARIIGYQPNNYVTLDLAGFVTLVNAIGGVEFNVPQRMLYSDPCQNLFINLQPGHQLLDGQQAMQLIRFRNYPEGDIQRIRVQQEFLGALVEQLLQARNLLIVDDLIRIFRDTVDTDLTIRNLGFFAHEFLRMDRENIRFHYVDSDIANIADNINGASVVTLFVEPWLELINAYMNPFTWDITVDDVRIVSRNPQTRALTVTDGTFYRTRIE